jgi:cell pole-organizing protein PopZ
MTQPAKVQEPSMEEILASIRRIIADDEAKPAVAEKPAAPAAPARPEKPAVAAPAARAPVMNNIPPSTVAPAKPAVAKPAPAPPPAKPAPAASNSQDDIDAMLAGFDVVSEPEVPPAPAPAPADVFELTDDMALPKPAVAAPVPQPAFQKVEPQDDLEFAESGSRAMRRQQSFESPSFESQPAPQQQILSRSTVSAVESAFNSLANTVLSANARTLEDLVKEMLRPMLQHWLDNNLPTLVERLVRQEIERVARGR